jgi:phenylalanine-4-hydroxylase
MGKSGPYTARTPDAKGYVDYSEDDHAVWATLYERQRSAVAQAACPAFLEGLDHLQLSADRVPQLPEVSARLRKATGWEVVPVPALIPFETFLRLLSQRQFPAATFVRRRDELDYLEEPDLFHEIFGHVPLLTHPSFAAFQEAYGRHVLQASPEEQRCWERLYWFTIEFGLVRGAGGDCRIYGGGILSSIHETRFALSTAPERRPFDLLEVLRTPYRIDIPQPRYFVLESLEQLFELARVSLADVMAEALRLGPLPAPYDAELPSPRSSA